MWKIERREKEGERERKVEGERERVSERDKGWKEEDREEEKIFT